MVTWGTHSVANCKLSIANKRFHGVVPVPGELHESAIEQECERLEA